MSNGASKYVLCLLPGKNRRVGIDFYRSRISSLNILNRSVQPIKIEMETLRKMRRGLD